MTYMRHSIVYMGIVYMAQPSPRRPWNKGADLPIILMDTDSGRVSHHIIVPRWHRIRKLKAVI